VPLVEEVPLFPRVSKEGHCFWWSVDFAPLAVEGSALVLLAAQFPWRAVPFGHVYKTIFHAGARVHPEYNELTWKSIINDSNILSVYCNYPKYQTDELLLHMNQGHVSCRC